MDGLQGKLRNSLQFKLASSLSAIIIVLATVAGLFSFWNAFEEANELQDEQLRQMAALIDQREIPVRQLSSPSHEQGQDSELRFIVQSLSAPVGLALPGNLVDGMQTVNVGADAWRIFVKTMRSGARLAVGQQSAVRDEAAHGSALRTVLPLLALVPILLVLVGAVVSQSLRPVVGLSRELDRRAEHDLSPLRDGEVPNEIRPFTASINRLLARVAGAMQVQRRFVADAAHELRSPLTALTLQAEALADADLPQDAHDQVARLQKGMRRTRAMLDQLLTLARFEANATTARASAISVSAALRSVMEEQMPLAEARRIDLGVSSEGPDAFLCVRDVELHAILRNLIDNALRFTPTDGRVDVALAKSGDVVTVEVTDTGPGIPEAERERVFDAFYRVLGTDTDGSGLGLSIVKTLADRMGATVSLHDAVPGAPELGLRVAVTFPNSVVSS